MKKVLSFVLVLALVLGSFSMAFAATPAQTGLSDIAGNANEEAIQVVNDLGIVTGNPDGTFLPAKDVNRAEFAAMITRALAIPQSALAGYTSTSFKDTAGYSWAVPYLAFCQSKGIMLGDGNGNAMPGRTINMNEAVTMVLRAIGYTSNSAELVGAWPSNYVTKAQDLDLYDNVAKVVNVDKANAAQIVYNALTVQKVAVNSDGKTEGLANIKVNGESMTASMLTTGLNCTSKDGVMGGNISDDDSIINVAKYAGQYGTAYLNKDEEVVAFKPDCTKLVGTYIVTGAGFDEDFNTTDADVDYTNKTTTTGIYFFDNGKSGKSSNTKDDEYTLYADVSGKTINKVYSVMHWEVTADDMVSATDVKDITDDQSLLGVDFTLDDDDAIDLKSFELVGVPSLDKIAKDNVVYVYAGGKDKEITKIEVGTATVTGVVKDFKAENKKFALDSTKYRNAKTVINGISTNGSNITGDEVGDSVKAYLDARGYVYDFDNETTSANTIAFVDAKDNTGLNYAARLILNDGSSKVINAKDNATYEKITVDSLMKYGLNKDGEISTVETTSSGYTIATGAAATTTFSSTTLVKGVGTTTQAKGLVIKSDVIVFTYDTGTTWINGGDYDVTTIDKVEINEKLTGDIQVLLDDKGKVIAIMMSEKDCKGGADDIYAVINDLYKTSDADGDKVQRIEGFGNGAKLDVLTDGEGVVPTNYPRVEYNTTEKAFKVTLFKLKVDANGVVTKAEPVEGKDRIEGFVVKSADKRNSVTANNDDMFALAKNVVVYEVNSDSDYKVYTGEIKQGDTIVLYETDDDYDGYDVAVINRLERK